MKTRETKTLASLTPVQSHSTVRDSEKFLLLSDEAKADDDETNDLRSDVTEYTTRSRRSLLRGRKTTQQKPVLTPLQPLHESPNRSNSPFSQSLSSENGLLWIGMDEVLEGAPQSSILESRLKDTISLRRNTKNTRSSRLSLDTSTNIVSSTNNNIHNHINNNLLKDDSIGHRKDMSSPELHESDQDVLLFRVESMEESHRHLTESHVIKDNRVSTIHQEGVLKGSHRETRREKKAKVKLKEDDCTPDESEIVPKEYHTLVEMKPLDESHFPLDDKKRKKDDKNRRKKLKHLEEENLSKRLYDCRSSTHHESRSQMSDLIVGTPQPLPAQDETFDSTVTSHRSEEDRRSGVLRLKACGECGARHSGSICPFTRPTQRLPDKCPIPPCETSNHPHNGVIVAPPHKESPVNLSSSSSSEDNGSEESWRSPQRSGSPCCYARSSLPVGLTLEMRPMAPPQDNTQEDSDDGGMIGMPQPQIKDVEVVIAKVMIARYTQLGPVVGVPVKEKDIPDDFCMVNLWEVFGGDGKKYISTVEPRKSNWTRYLRPAPDRESANIVLVPRQLHDPTDDIASQSPGSPVECVGGVAIFLVTTQDINNGDELMFWAHDPTLAWSRKKMEKTNCGGCNMRFSHPLYYRMHCSVFHDPNYSLTIRKYHCKVCGLAVLGKENIMRHAAEQHEGRGAYQCQFCKKFFLRLNYLDMHRTYGCAANPQRTRPLCDFCGRKFCQPQKLKVHIKRMHSVFFSSGCWYCSCEQFFLRLHSLDMHVTYSCSKNPARVFPLCDYCGKKFCQPQHLRSHQKRMHADMAEVLREFQCKLCFKILGSRAALQRHLKEVHHKVNKDLNSGATCDRCGKMFQNKSNLKIHMLTHSGVKPFRCIESSCNAAFTTKQCLQFHYKKVHGYSGDSMPTIERCIPYTFDSYSGGLVADPDTGKLSQPPSRNSSVDTPTDVSLSQPDEGLQDPTTSMNSNDMSVMRSRSPSASRSPDLLPTTKLPPATTIHGYVSKYATAATRLVSKGSRKWMGDSLDSFEKDHDSPVSISTTQRDIYTFEDRNDVDSPRKRSSPELKLEDEKPFRRESNASLLVEAALNVAEGNMKTETRLMGTHDRLLSYSGAVNGATSSRYSPPITISSSDDHLLPHDTALSTHIKYTESNNDDRGQLEYTLEREYDPRDLPEVMVVHEGVSSRDLNDFHQHLHSALESLPSASTTVDGMQDIQDVHNLALTKTEVSPETAVSHSDATNSLSSNGVLEPTLHVLDQLPVTQGLASSLSSTSDVGLDMTYKHYRIVPETSLATGISHDQLLCSAHLDDPEGSIGLDTITSSTEIHTHPMSPRNDHLSDHIPLPELHPHDFRGLQTMRSPSRSPYVSPSHTPEESLRSYLISSESLRSPHSGEHGIDMSRNNVFIRTTDLPAISYRYQNDLVNTARTQVYEIERPSSHTVDLSLVGRSVSFTENARTGPSTIYVTDMRVGSTSPTIYLTAQRDDLRQSLDLSVSRSEEGLSQDTSPHTAARSISPEISSPHNLSPNNQLSPSSQLISYAQISPDSELSPLTQVSSIERTENTSPCVTTTQDSQDSSSPTPGTSLSTGTTLPPISRIVSASPHSFYSSRQQLLPSSRQDISMSLPTHVYTDSYVVTNATILDEQPPTPGPSSPTADSTTSKDRSSPYLQYPSSPYSRYHQELSSPPSGFHYQYY